HRPPGNRTPTPAEVAASEGVLLEQIRLIQPQVIGTLGNVPTQYFLRTNEGITRLRGRWHDWHGIRVMPLFHPAYLLRNPSRERPARPGRARGRRGRLPPRRGRRRAAPARPSRPTRPPRRRRRGARRAPRASPAPPRRPPRAPPRRRRRGARRGRCRQPSARQ